MKLATRISSILRMAWKACRSCSADSVSMWADSLASQALAGWMRSPSASRTRVTGSWASQSISRPGTCRRSSRAMATSRRAWPSPIGEDRYRARLGRRRARVQVRVAGAAPRPVSAPSAPSDPAGPSTPANSATSVFTLTGSRRLGGVPGAVEQDEPAPELAGQGRPDPGRDLGVLGPVDHQHRAADPRAERRHLGRVDDLGLPAAEPGQDRLHVGVQRPADAVLDLLGRVGLGEALGEEELEVSGPVAQPVAVGLLGPALVGPGLAVERVLPVLGLVEPQGRADQDQAGDPLGVLGGQDQRLAHVAPGDHHRPVDPGRVQHGQGVGGELAPPVGVEVLGPVRAAVAAGVEGDHPGVPGQVRDLALPEPGVDDLPGRREQDGRLPLPVPLPEHPHAVALDVPLLVGIAGAGLLGRRQQRGHLALPPSDSTNSRMQQVDLDRVAGLGAVAAALDGDQHAAGQLGHRRTDGQGSQPVVVPVDDQHRAADPAQDGLHLLPARRLGSQLGQDEGLGGRLQPPADHVLDLLGGVGLGEDLAGEELEEAPVVAQPVVAVELGPALVGVERLVERVGPPRVGRGDEGDARVDQHRAEDPLGPGRGQLDRPAAPPRQPDQHRPLGAGRSSTARASATYSASS